MFGTLGIMRQHRLYIWRRKKWWASHNTTFWVDGFWVSDIRFVVVWLNFMELAMCNQINQFIFSYQVGYTGVGFSQVVQLIWNCEIWCENWDDRDDVRMNIKLWSVLREMSLRRANQIMDRATIRAMSDQTSLHRNLVIRESTWTCKGRSKIATRLRSGIERNSENKQKKSCGCYGEQGHILTRCAKRKMARHHIWGDGEWATAYIS